MSSSEDKFLPKDENGFIINDTDESKILADFLPVIAESKQIIIDALADSLHSIYLTGSIPRGIAKIKKSDLDIFTILNPGYSESALAEINDECGKILQKTDVVSKIDVELWTFKEVFPASTFKNTLKKLKFSIIIK